MFCVNQSIETFRFTMGALKNSPQMIKNFKIGKNRFDVTIGFKHSDEEIKQSLVEQQMSKAIKVIKIVNQREPFIPVANEAIYEEIDHPVKKASLQKSEELKFISDKKEAIEIPEGISQDEIDDPDLLRNCPSLLYCQERVKKLKLAVDSSMKNQVLIDSKIRAKYLAFQKHQLGIQSAIENEQITFDKYLEFLEKSLKHDKILYDYFVSMEDGTKAAIVKFRME